jgi:hypothetical protein
MENKAQTEEAKEFFNGKIEEVGKW